MALFRKIGSRLFFARRGDVNRHAFIISSISGHGEGIDLPALVRAHSHERLFAEHIEGCDSTSEATLNAFDDSVDAIYSAAAHDGGILMYGMCKLAL